MTANSTTPPPSSATSPPTPPIPTPAAARTPAANASDPVGRPGLEKQAADLSRVAAENRQIDAYNKIIAKVNSGNYRDATKALNELLATATDPAIIRDAKKLQKQLADYRP